MADSPCFTITKPVRQEVRIKRSVFIGSLEATVDRNAAEAYVDRIRSEYADASHNCFAYRLDRDNFRYYDDGEPSSTAGKPILAMLDKYQVVQATLVVTRYFGGTKLGVGGLIQAYGRCAEETLQHAALQRLIHYHSLEISYPYNLTRQFQYLVDKLDVDLQKSAFGTDVTSIVRVPEERLDQFKKELNRTGNGRFHITIVDH